jgi:hypothetical protein
MDICPVLKDVWPRPVIAAGGHGHDGYHEDG